MEKSYHLNHTLHKFVLSLWAMVLLEHVDVYPGAILSMTQSIASFSHQSLHWYNWRCLDVIGIVLIKPLKVYDMNGSKKLGFCSKKVRMAAKSRKYRTVVQASIMADSPEQKVEKVDFFKLRWSWLFWTNSSKILEEKIKKVGLGFHLFDDESTSSWDSLFAKHWVISECSYTINRPRWSFSDYLEWNMYKFCWCGQRTEALCIFVVEWGFPGKTP